MELNWFNTRRKMVKSDIPNDLHVSKKKHRPLFKNVSMDSELIFYLQE